jgi:hypothetical protein
VIGKCGRRQRTDDRAATAKVLAAVNDIGFIVG